MKKPLHIRLDSSSSSPKYAQLRDKLAAAIGSGQLSPGEKLPPEGVLAEELGISRNTVRQAIAELIQQGRVVRRHGSGTFVCEGSGSRQNSAHSQSRTVGVLVRDIRSVSDVYPEIIRGIEDVCATHDCHVLLGNTDDQVDKMSRYIARFLSAGVRGAIISPLARHPASLEMYQQLIDVGIDTILINRSIPGLDLPAVVCDDVLGGYMATKHLLDRGHSRIAAVFPPPYATVKARERGYRNALDEKGLQPEDGYVQYSCLDDPDPGRTLVTSLLALKEPPEAIFAFTDELAAQVYEALVEKGIDVPREMALVGYNDCRIAVSLPVPLTSVAYPKYEIGHRAAELLLDGNDHTGESIVVPPELVVRRSTPAVHTPTV
jgi:GntR family transcriptional regulator of arabinose operon